MTENRIMAIDYGGKRIGIALSDPLKIFAYPHTTISNTNNKIKEITDIISEYNVTEIILGYPLKENGEFTDATKSVEKFHKELVSKLTIPIQLWDERYSSSIAHEKIIESVTSKKKRRDKSLVDKTAAAVILQEYLDEQK